MTLPTTTTPVAASQKPLVDAARAGDRSWDQVLDRRLLQFLDEQYESDFRTAEREHNISQARFGLGLALALNLLYGALDPLVYAADALLWVSLIRVVGMTALLGLFIGLTYLPFFRTRWPMLLVWGEFVFALGYGAVNVVATRPLCWSPVSSWWYSAVTCCCR